MSMLLGPSGPGAAYSPPRGQPPSPQPQQQWQQQQWPQSQQQWQQWHQQQAQWTGNNADPRNFASQQQLQQQQQQQQLQHQQLQQQFQQQQQSLGVLPSPNPTPPQFPLGASGLEQAQQAQQPHPQQKSTNDISAGWQPTAGATQKNRDFESLRDESIFAVPLPVSPMHNPQQRQQQFPPPGSPERAADRFGWPRTGSVQSEFGSQVSTVQSVMSSAAPGAWPAASSMDGSPCQTGGTARSGPPGPPAQLHQDMSLAALQVSFQSVWDQLQSSITQMAKGWCSPNRNEWPSPRSRALSGRLDANAEYCLQNRSNWSIRTSPPLRADSQTGGSPSMFAGCRPDDAETTNYIPRPSKLHVSSDKLMTRSEMNHTLLSNHVSICSLKGNKATSPNQDRAVVASLGSGACQFMGVFDGHGEAGHQVAEVVAEVLPKLLLYSSTASAGAANRFSSQQPLPQVASTMFNRASFAQNPQEAASSGHASDTNGNWELGVTRAFEEMHEYLEALTASSAVDGDRAGDGLGGMFSSAAGAGRVDARASGTTATAALLLPGQRLLVAHVGDSRCVLGTRPRGSSPSTPWRCMHLTEDHKPDLAAERSRIESCGAQVVTVGVPPNSTSRVFTPGQTWPSINMSRSLGDLHAHTQGLSATPEVRLTEQFWNPAYEEGVLIIGSDGLWDVVDAETAVELACQSVNGEPAAALAHEAYERWGRRNLQANYSDDITVSIKFL